MTLSRGRVVQVGTWELSHVGCGVQAQKPRHERLHEGWILGGLTVRNPGSGACKWLPAFGVLFPGTPGGWWPHLS